MKKKKKSDPNPNALTTINYNGRSAVCDIVSTEIREIETGHTLKKFLSVEDMQDYLLKYYNIDLTDKIQKMEGIGESRPDGRKPTWRDK